MGDADVLPLAVNVKLSDDKRLNVKNEYVRSNFSQAMAVFTVSGLLAHGSIAVVCFDMRAKTSDTIMHRP